MTSIDDFAWNSSSYWLTICRLALSRRNSPVKQPTTIFAIISSPKPQQLEFNLGLLTAGKLASDVSPSETI
jgi:hypothetical protein